MDIKLSTLFSNRLHPIELIGPHDDDGEDGSGKRQGYLILAKSKSAEGGSPLQERKVSSALSRIRSKRWGSEEKREN